MEDLDAKIREALKTGDPAMFPDDEPALRELIAATLRSRYRSLTVLTWCLTLVFFVLQVLSAVRFFQAQSTDDRILWATAFLFFGMGVAMLKMFTWMEMERYAVIREIKRLELQVARLEVRWTQNPDE